MNAFTARLTLSTPYAGDSVPTLDAVLAAEMATETGQHFAPYPTDLPLMETPDGVPLASQGYLLTDNLVTEQKLFTATARDVSHQVMTFGRGLSKPDTVPQAASTLASIKSTGYAVRMRAVELIEWRGVGDIEEIGAILRSMFAVGQRRAKGCGVIKEVDIFAVDENPDTWGLVDAGGMPLRPVPANLWRGGPAPLAMVRWRVPYWDASIPPTLCVVPPTQLLEDVA